MNALMEDIGNDFEVQCPYCNVKADVCGASLTSLRLGIWTRLKYCSSNNYDDCVLFLSKSLRSGNNR